VFASITSWSVAIFLAAGVGLTQILLGGWWYPWLALPGYLLLAAAAIMASLRGWKISDTPGAWCSGLALAFAGYLFWRQSSSLDAYAAREDAWLLLGALCVYLTVAWHLRGTGPRWLLIGVLLALSIAQVLLAVAQFAAVLPFHPMADLARQLRLPDGKLAVANLGLITGTLHARTALSGVLEVTTFLALGLLVWGRCAVWVKLLLLWAAAAGFVGMIICLSRSAYLALPAGVIVFALASFFVVQRGVLKHRLLLAVGALGLVGLALGLGVATGYESLAVWFRLDELAVDKYRQDLWTITVPPMLSLDPVFGAGANTFEDLARRYRGVGFTADPIHAHSDWLQLLIEYGWIGLVLGAGFFFVHFAAGWRNVLRLARATPADGLLPQSMELGLATGSLAAFAAIGTHVVFDYSLHFQSWRC
jgi:O-Antigen ligase.